MKSEKSGRGRGMSIVHLLKAFETDRGWVKFQIDSFNAFVDHIIGKLDNIPYHKSKCDHYQGKYKRQKCLF